MNEFQSIIGFDIPIGFCYATCDDIFRKPMIGIYNLYLKKLKFIKRIIKYYIIVVILVVVIYSLHIIANYLLKHQN